MLWPIWHCYYDDQMSHLFVKCKCLKVSHVTKIKSHKIVCLQFFKSSINWSIRKTILIVDEMKLFQAFANDM